MKVPIPTIDILQKLYIDDRKSTRFIGAMFGVGHRTVARWLAIYAIPIRTKSDEHKANLSKSLKGRKFSEDTKHLMKECKVGIPVHSSDWKANLKENLRGKNNPNWRHGLTSLHEQIRKCVKYKEWRISVLLRDKRKCVICGSRKNLEVDHIKSFSEILTEYKIINLQTADECSILWDVENGRVLCTICHEQTPTWGAFSRKKK